MLDDDSKSTYHKSLASGQAGCPLPFPDCSQPPAPGHHAVFTNNHEKSKLSAQEDAARLHWTMLLGPILESCAMCLLCIGAESKQQIVCQYIQWLLSQARNEICASVNNSLAGAAALLVLPSRLSCWQQQSTEQQRQDSGCSGRLPGHTDSLELGRALELQVEAGG